MAIQRETVNGVRVLSPEWLGYWSRSHFDEMRMWVVVRHGDIFGRIDPRCTVLLAVSGEGSFRYPKPTVRVYPIPAGTNQGSIVRRLALTGPDRKSKP